MWKLEAAPDGFIRARHAKRGSTEETLRLEALAERMAPYFHAGPIIDQAWQPRLAEGAIRCYLVQDRVEASVTRRSTRCTLPSVDDDLLAP